MEAIDHICELYNVDEDVVKILKDIVNLPDEGKYTFSLDKRIDFNLPIKSQYNIAFIIYMPMGKNPIYLSKGSYFSLSSEFIDDKRYYRYHFNCDILKLAIEEHIVDYVMFILTELLLYKYNEINTKLLFPRNYHIMLDFDYLLIQMINESCVQEYKCQERTLDMKIYIGNYHDNSSENKIIKWEFCGKEQDVNDEIHMARCYLMIHCKDYKNPIVDNKSARF